MLKSENLNYYFHCIAWLHAWLLSFVCVWIHGHVHNACSSAALWLAVWAKPPTSPQRASLKIAVRCEQTDRHIYTMPCRGQNFILSIQTSFQKWSLCIRFQFSPNEMFHQTFPRLETCTLTVTSHFVEFHSSWIFFCCCFTDTRPLYISRE